MISKCFIAFSCQNLFNCTLKTEYHYFRYVPLYSPLWLKAKVRHDVEVFTPKTAQAEAAPTDVTQPSVNSNTPPRRSLIYANRTSKGT